MSDLSMRLTSTVTADSEGVYELGAVSAGPYRVLVDGREIVNQWESFARGGEFFGLVSKEHRASVHLDAGQTAEVVVETRTPFEHGIPGIWMLRLGFDRANHDHEMDEAIALAAETDVAILFVGLNGEWDTEGYDRPHMDLPGRQNELIQRVAAVNPNTVVVLQTGGPVRTPWLGDVAAVLQAWYPGQECGNAIADVLFGTVNPSGRLPQTWPFVVEHAPANQGYPGERGQVVYHEGIYAGYRGFESRKIEPQYPFGFGRSYSTFKYGVPSSSSAVIEPGETLSVRVPVSNTGEHEGAEVVQFYVYPLQSAIERPVRELKGFDRVEIKPGETVDASASLDMRSFAYFDDQRNCWVADAGTYCIEVAASAADVRSTIDVELAREWVCRVEDCWLNSHI
jgi:beta-glucosidase